MKECSMKECSMKDVLFLLTGGTIDSRWDPAQDTAVPLDKSELADYVRKYIKPGFKITEKVVTLRDSREIDDNIRNVIFDDIKKAKTDYILVTHGTFTMAETGRFLKKKIKSDETLKNKRIVLVGSMYPFSGFALTDATFNLGFALGVLREMKPGIGIVMNGQILDVDRAEKCLSSATFVEN